MAADAEEQEPSIEEILASIRQIISDDDEEGGDEDASVAAVPVPEPEPEPTVVPEAAKPEDDVLELTDVVGDDEPEFDDEETFGDVVEDEPAPAIKEKIEIDMQDRDDSDDEDDDDSDILTNNAQKAAMDGFSALMGNMAVERSGRLGNITLEDIVRELMRPMLRDWLDQNLPPLIEKLVQKELQRLANKVMDK